MALRTPAANPMPRAADMDSRDWVVVEEADGNARVVQVVLEKLVYSVALDNAVVVENVVMMA